MLCKFRKITEWAQTLMTMIQQFQKNYINHEWNAATHYKVDDKVWLDLQNIKTDRLMKKLNICHVKFTILEHIESYTYQLNMLSEIKNIFHIYLLWLAHEDLFLSQIQTDWQLLSIVINDNDDNKNEKYIIERIIDEQTVNIEWDHQWEFLVKWVEYTWSTWESVMTFENTIILDCYENAQHTSTSDEDRNNVRSWISIVFRQSSWQCHITFNYHIQLSCLINFYSCSTIMFNYHVQSLHFFSNCIQSISKFIKIL